VALGVEGADLGVAVAVHALDRVAGQAQADKAIGTRCDSPMSQRVPTPLFCPRTPYVPMG
jgi:hypothetical protein